MTYAFKWVSGLLTFCVAIGLATTLIIACVLGPPYLITLAVGLL